jgi:hypothetical protein
MSLKKLVDALPISRVIFKHDAYMARVTVSIQGFAGCGYSDHCGERLPFETVYDWKQTPDFMQAVEAARADLVQNIDDCGMRCAAVEELARRPNPHYSNRETAMDESIRKQESHAKIENT